MNKLKIDTTIKDAIITAFHTWHDRPFLWTNINDVYTPKTYGEVIGTAFALAEYFMDQGLKDEKIAIFAKNSAEWVSADYAITLSSNVSLLIDASWQLFEVQNVVRFIEPRVLLYDKTTSSIILHLKKSMPNTLFMSLEDLPEPQDNVPASLPLRNPKELAKIFFSSGTTDRPKAIMLSETNMLFGWDEISRRMKGVGPDDVCYVFLPFHHVYANVIILLYVLPIGCQIYLCSSIKDVKKELQLARPTIIHGVPLFYERIYGAIPQPTLQKAHRAIRLANALHFNKSIRKILFAQLHNSLGGHIKYLISGGARLDPVIRKFFYEAGLDIITAYAATETAGSLFASVDSTKYESVGRPYKGVFTKIIKPDKTGVGEIAVKGPNVFLGYYDNEAANENAFDNDEYYHTGDLGKFDEEGELHIIGRKKRMILLSNGENVWPDEIEALLHRTKSIVSSRVFSQDASIRAMITISDISNRSSAEKHCMSVNSKLPKYSKIKHFDYVVADESIKIKS
jgi:long-chain acyl-CoA synthetase